MDGPDASATPVLRVEKLVAGGRGLARAPDGVWLIDGGVPGDLVRAEPRVRRPGLVEAGVVDRVEPSPDRREAPCPIQARCGGCPWMVLPEVVQREWKRRILEESLRRIAGLDGVDVEPVRASARALGYRNKVELAVVRHGGTTRVGFHAAGAPGRIVDVERCLLQGEPGQRVLAHARRYFVHGAGAHDPALGGREPVRLVIRASSSTGRVLVALRGGPGPFPAAREFARAVAGAVAEVTGVVRILARPGRRGGAAVVVLAGRSWIEEALGGHRFRVPATTFFQVNPPAAETLVELVLELAAAGRGTRVTDLYAGVGVHALALARAGARVTACEADGAAVACGRRAAAEAGRRVRFVSGDVRGFLESSGARPEVVIANPPRTGLGRGVVEALAGCAARRIVMVSCDPATLARDLRGLTDRGYRVARVVPVDLFPQTAHVESVTLLVSASRSRS